MARILTTKKIKLKVFIVHGHDEPALYRLEKMIQKEFDLECIILRDLSGKGRTLIEKFEDEAQDASFVFALFTQDDKVKSAEYEYAQARPNVIFEFGWFYGKLGRKKVCILNKKWIAIHSDLNGISYIEFEDINDKFLDIRNELRCGIN